MPATAHIRRNALFFIGAGWTTQIRSARLARPQPAAIMTLASTTKSSPCPYVLSVVLLLLVPSLSLYGHCPPRDVLVALCFFFCHTFQDLVCLVLIVVLSSQSHPQPHRNSYRKENCLFQMCVRFFLYSFMFSDRSSPCRCDSGFSWAFQNSKSVKKMDDMRAVCATRGPCKLRHGPEKLKERGIAKLAHILFAVSQNQLRNAYQGSTDQSCSFVRLHKIQSKKESNYACKLHHRYSSNSILMFKDHCIKTTDILILLEA
jgi:hypothetical protein